MIHIFLAAVIVLDTKVRGIIKSAFMIPVTKAVGPELLGDGSGIFTEIFGDFIKRETLV